MSIPLENDRVRPSQVGSLKASVAAASFAALAAAGGYLLMFIPNVEVFSLILFVAGYSVGPLRGVAAACSASILYFGFNPQGGFFPPLLAAQILGSSLNPLAGSLFRRSKVEGLRSFLLVSSAGAVTTFAYDLLTNLAFPLTAGFDLNQIGVTLALGVPFAAVHIGSNAAIFFLLAPRLMRLTSEHGWRF